MIYANLIISSFLFSCATLYAIVTLFEAKIKSKKFDVLIMLVVSSLMVLSSGVVYSDYPFFMKLFVVFISVLTKAICYYSLIHTNFWQIIYVTLLTFSFNRIFEAILAFEIFDVIEGYITPYLINAVFITLVMLYIRKKERYALVRETIPTIPTKVYTLILILSVLLCMFLWAVMTPGRENMVKILLIPLVLGYTIIVFSVMRVSIDARHEKTVSDNLVKQIENQIDYYNKISKIYDEFRSFRHDFKNHLICLRSLLSEDEIEKAVEYINSIEKMSAVGKKPFETGSIIIDALLSEKQDKAVEVGAEIVFNGVVPTDGISNVDLCIIFSNAIDNAIEACAKDRSKSHKQIEIKSNVRQGYYFLLIKNPMFDKVLVKKNNKYVTSKDNKTLHGYGISNITRSVKKYNGKIDISPTDNNFIVDIELLLNNDMG